MVAINELRIGNLVMLADSQHEIDWQTLKALSDSKRSDLKKLINPISLTPEILERCGFEISTRSWYEKWQKRINRKVFNVVIHDVGCRYVNSQGHHDHIYFNYLHQLQNLYFACTGEELITNYEIDYVRVFPDAYKQVEKLYKKQQSLLKDSVSEG